MSYADFLARKALVSTPTGIADVPPLSERLKEHETLLTRWALRRGRAAVFADTGLGKGWIAMEWARVVTEYVRMPALILAPLAVSQQFERESQKLGDAITVAASQADVGSDGVYVTNYHKLHKFDPDAFGGVAIDECFAKGTLVDTAVEGGALVRRSIEDVHVGDHILNASGIDLVSDIHRREVPYAVRLEVRSQRFTCSPNHPIFTDRGWVGAQDLIPGDAIFNTGAAVRLVRSGRADCGADKDRQSILRSILLSEMANETTRDHRESSYKRSTRQDRQEAYGMVEIRESDRVDRIRKNSQSQSDAKSRDLQEDINPIERDRPRTFRAWGQRAWFDEASEDTAGCTRVELASGICFVVGSMDSRLSEELQNRLSRQREQNSYRGGWVLPFGERQEASGCEKGRDVAFARVDSLEILQQGHPDLERLRDADGKLYFYDLGGTRHPSFSVNGLLVHNSSILKSLDGKTRRLLIDSFRETPFRLSLTATPSPNDHVELGGQSEFLGVMTHAEMLATFFVHDGGSTKDWRLKGHARDAFWKWVTSWGAIVKFPSDIGASDDGYVLPPLIYHEHIVPANQDDLLASGVLFAKPAEGLSEQRDARRDTIASRCALSAKIANEASGQVIVWCDLNAESEYLRDAINGSVEVTGSQDDDEKERRIADFVSGKARVLVSKPSICGWGLNLQFVRTVVFCGVTHSFEQFYQAVRRCWRFGVEGEVNVHVISSELEGNVVASLREKQRKADELSTETRHHVSAFIRTAVASARRETIAYEPQREIRWPEWLQTESA